jgi:hypothetical protein
LQSLHLWHHFSLAGESCNYWLMSHFHGNSLNVKSK